MTWPRASAEVVSSRVINVSGPQKLQPELVFRYDAAGQSRERIIVPNWSSASYGMVRRFVDRYPAGRRLMVGVNPEDPDDIAYELEWSFRQQRGQLFDSRIAFRYLVDGRAYTNATTYGVASSNRDGVRVRIDAFAPGTSHPIRYRPGDPNVIRFDLDNWWATFGLALALMALMAMGARFLTMGAVVVKVFHA